MTTEVDDLVSCFFPLKSGDVWKRNAISTKEIPSFSKSDPFIAAGGISTTFLITNAQQIYVKGFLPMSTPGEDVNGTIKIRKYVECKLPIELQEIKIEQYIFGKSNLYILTDVGDVVKLRFEPIQLSGVFATVRNGHRKIFTPTFVNCQAVVQNRGIPLPIKNFAVNSKGIVMIDSNGKPWIKLHKEKKSKILLSNVYCKKVNGYIHSDNFALIDVNDELWTGKPDKLSITSNIPPVKSIFCGVNCYYFIDKEGQVWAKGDNSTGLLGFGDKNPRENFTKIQLPKKISYIKCFNRCTMFIDESGNVSGVGCNEDFFIEPKRKIHSVPSEFLSLTKVKGCPEVKIQ